MSKEQIPGPRAKRTRRKVEQLSWASVPVQSLRSFIGICTDNGAAVLFGRTMDGGALMLQVLNGKDRYKEYLTTYADVVPVMADIIEEMVDSALADIVMEADK